jgi:V8-like Glu-specific endopeptidase
LAGIAALAPAIVIRHDRAVADYNAIGSNANFNATGFFAGTGSNFAFGTGFMVSPTVVVTAAHLFDSDSNGVLDDPVTSIGFGVGNNTSVVANNVQSIAINPAWVTTNGAARNDWAVVTLNSAINGLNYARIHNGNATGNQVTAIGYGAQGIGTTGWVGSGVLAGANDRLGANNILDRQRNGAWEFDFDSPAGNANTIATGSATPLNLEGTTASGDSGSPLFTQFGGQWFVIGALFGGTTGNSPYGDISIYSALFGQQQNIDFLTQNGVQVVPEPMTMAALGLAALAAARRRNQKKR